MSIIAIPVKTGHFGKTRRNWNCAYMLLRKVSQRTQCLRKIVWTFMLYGWERKEFTRILQLGCQRIGRIYFRERKYPGIEYFLWGERSGSKHNKKSRARLYTMETNSRLFSVRLDEIWREDLKLWSLAKEDP